MTLPDPVLTAARYAYSAHRFECLLPGHFERAWNVDMRSAYPWAALQLPDWPAGRWVNQNLRSPNRLPALLHATWAVPAGRAFGPFPWRYPDGALCYPRRGSSWVWSPEYDAAVSLWGGSIRFTDAWTFLPYDPSARPWAASMDLLAKRAIFPPVKKFLNAAPGKLAQSWPYPGPWLDPVSAGLVTSLVRGRMLALLGRLGGSVVAILGDGLLLRRDPATIKGVWDGDFVQGDGPGQWRVRVLDDVLCVSHALYFAGQRVATANERDEPGHPFHNTRDAFEAAWRARGIAGEVEIAYRHQTSIADALQSLPAGAVKASGIGEWVTATQTVGFAPHGRISEGAVYRGRYAETRPLPAPDPLRMLGAELRFTSPLPETMTMHSWPFWDESMTPQFRPVELWPGSGDEL